jgi:hypothetical protein
MFALKCLLLNIEYVQMYVPKALVEIFSMCSLHVILLSEMTPKYLTLFTNGDVPSFHLKVVLRHSSSSREVDRLSLPFVIFILQR